MTISRENVQSDDLKQLSVDVCGWDYWWDCCVFFTPSGVVYLEQLLWINKAKPTLKYHSLQCDENAIVAEKMKNIHSFTPHKSISNW